MDKITNILIFKLIDMILELKENPRTIDLKYNETFITLDNVMEFRNLGICQLSLNEFNKLLLYIFKARNAISQDYDYDSIRLYDSLD